MFTNMFTSIILTISIMLVAGMVSGWMTHRDANAEE